MEKDAKTRLIETATPLFAQRGFTGVSVRDLAHAADVNVAAISYHFGSKEGLYQAVLEDLFWPIAQALEMLKTLPPLSGEQRLSMYAERIAGIHRQRPYLIRIMVGEMSNPTACFEAVVKKYISQIYNFIFTAISDGIADGAFKPGLNVGHAAVSLAGIMNFYFFAKPLWREFLPPVRSQSDDDYTAQAFSIFMNGIRREEE